MDDLQIVKAAIKGDKEAFYQLIKVHSSQLYRIALSYFNDEEAALEAIQEVTYRTFRNIGRVKNAEYFKTWLIRIMLNYCNDELKRRKKVLPLIRNHEEGEEIDPTDYIQVLESMNRLNPNYKKVVLLRYFEDLTIREISEIMDRPEGTIKTWLHRALNVLRKYFEKEGGYDV